MAESESRVEDAVDMIGDFNSMGVLMEQICKTDMKIIATNPERIWKHDGSKKGGWKPDTTQLSSGALFQISEVIKISGVSGKGWNESSEYIMGKIADGKWIRLINFRGYATAVPDTDSFKRRAQKLVGKIQDIQDQMKKARDRRELAERRCNEAEKRVSTTEEARKMAEQRVKEFEENFKKMEKLGEEKEEVAAKSVDIAKREAQEAKVLMRYFENRMADSEKSYQDCAENLVKAEETIRIKDKEAHELEQQIKKLEALLEESERARVKLETKLNTVTDKQQKAERERKESIRETKKGKKTQRKNTNPVE